MMNIIKSSISIIILGSLLLISACSEDWALKEETFVISDENDGWVPSEVDEESFIMVDNSGISHGFVMSNEEYYLDKSWGGLFGLNTHMTFTEYRSRSYKSTYGITYSTSIRASTWDPYGDEINVYFNDLNFRYDLSLNLVTEVSFASFNTGATQTSEGYEFEGDILSECELLDSHTINSNEYSDILHFILKDKPSKWNDFSVVEVFIAKDIGLIKFVLNDGTLYLRELG